MTDTLWENIRREVYAESEREPSLASYFHSAVLSHDSLESALAYGLSSLLGNEVISPLTLYQVMTAGFSGDPELTVRMRRDLTAHYDRDPACE